MLRPVLIVCAAAVALGAAPAMAQVETHSRVVHYGDLNLDQTRDADRLVSRIERAAADVCLHNDGRRLNARLVRFERDCVTVAEGDAIADVGHPMVYERYYGRRPDIVIEGSYDPDYTPKS